MSGSADQPQPRPSSVTSHPAPSTSTSTATPSKTLQRLLHLTPNPNSLENLTLSNLLNNQTCPPISFPDFALFIERKEFTLENLLFVVWFRSYRLRWEALSADEKKAVPIPDTRLGKRRDPFGYLSEASVMESKDSLQGGPSVAVREVPRRSSHAPPLPSHPFKVCEWAQENAPVRFPTSSMAPIPRTKRADSIPCGQCLGCTNPKHRHDVKAQPMRLEAARAFATFLRKGGSRELGIADDLREECSLALEGSSAPEVFLPIYEETYRVVETQSLPHFLTYAKANVNRPKQLFWYGVGAIDFLIALAIFLPLLFLLPAQPFGLRAYRLFSVPFASFGCMQAYSAYRGFCSQVWGRASRQLKPWEMDLADDEEEALEGVEPLLDAQPTSRKEKKQAEKEEMEMKQRGTNSTSTQETTFITTPQEFADPFAPIAAPDDDTLGALPNRTTYTRPATDHPFNPSPTSATFTLSPWSASTDDMKSPTSAAPLWPPPSDDPIPGGAAMAAHLSRRRATAPTIASPLPLLSADKVFPFAEAETTAAERFEIFPFDSPFGEPSSTSGLRNRKPSVLSGGFVFDEPDPESTALRSGSVHTILASRMRQSSSKSVGTQTPGESELGEMRRTPVFGPERTVLDPRVKKLFDDVVRDILVVGALVAAAWIALCLAVPGQG